MQKAKFWLSLPQFLSPVGRISRLQYLVHSLILLTFVVICSLFNQAVGRSLDVAHGRLLAVTVTSLINAYLYFCLDAKRIHDLNWPAIIVVIILGVPVIVAIMYLVFSYAEFHPRSVIEVMRITHPFWRIASVIFGLILLFIPGNHGKNKYGPDPLLPPAPPIEVF